jgi:hypothetical protein
LTNDAQETFVLNHNVNIIDHFHGELVHTLQGSQHLMGDIGGHQVNGSVFFVQADVVLNLSYIATNQQCALIAVEAYLLFYNLELFRFLLWLFWE